MSETLENAENAENKEQNKIEVDDLEIIVTGSSEEPYYSLKYHIPDNNYYTIGYSSYCLQTVFRFRDEYFTLVSKKEAEVVKVEHLKKKLEEYAVGQCSSLIAEQVEISIERLLDLLEECKEVNK